MDFCLPEQVEAPWPNGPAPADSSGNLALRQSVTRWEKEKISIRLMDAKLSQVRYIYDGKEKRPEVTVNMSEYETLTEGADYTVLYENNVKAGTASVKVVGINSYTGTILLNFTIEETGGRKETDGGKDSGGTGTAGKITSSKKYTERKSRQKKIAAQRNKDNG